MSSINNSAAKLRGVTQGFVDNVYKFIASKSFLWIVVAGLVLQGVWVAVSFSYPLLFDETFHFSIIQIFSNTYSPIIVDQPTKYDYLRDLTNEASYVYHYLMSYPLRIIEIFTSDKTVQIIILRLMNVAFVALGIIVYSKALTSAGVKQAYVNGGMLVFVLLPIVPYLAGTINYDNLLFLMTALFALACVRFIKKGSVTDANNIALVLLAGVSASLIKYTFLPIFFVAILALVVFTVRRRPKKYFKKLGASFRKNINLGFSIILTLLVITTALFSAIYIKNVVVYGTPRPSCFETLGKERCLSGYIERRNYMVKNTADSREAQDLWQYLTIWHGYMVDGASNVSVVSRDEMGKQLVVKNNGLPTYSNLLALGLIVAVAGFLMSVRGHGRFDATLGILLIIAATGVLAVFMKNLTSYYAFNIAMANQPRYLLIILPIVLAVLAYYFHQTVRKKAAVVLSFVAVVMLSTQGGGITSLVVNSQPNWFREDSFIRSVNGTMKEFAQPVIKEGQGPLGL